MEIGAWLSDSVCIIKRSDQFELACGVDFVLESSVCDGSERSGRHVRTNNIVHPTRRQLIGYGFARRRLERTDCTQHVKVA